MDPHATGLDAARLAAVVEDEARYPTVEDVLPPPGSRWLIPPELGRLLARVVVQLPLRSVLEMGAGRSSIVLARALELA